MRQLILSAFLTIIISISSMANIPGTWINHSGIDIDSHLNINPTGYNHICKMLESDRYIYILGAGALHNDRVKGMTEKRYLLSYIDKNSGEWISLANRYPLSGQFVEDMAYSPQSGILTVVYDNLKVDFISEKDDCVITSNALAHIQVPGGVIPGELSYSIDGKTVVLTTNFGLISFDVASGNPVDFIRINSKLKSAGLVGDRYIVADGSGLYSIPVGSTPHSLSDLTPLEIQYLTPSGVAAIIPVDDVNFLSATINSSKFNIFGVTLDKDSYSSVGRIVMSEAVKGNEMAINASFVNKSLSDGLIIPTPAGIAVSASDNFILINYAGATPDFSSTASTSEFKEKYCVTVPKYKGEPAPGSYGKECYQKATTSDGVNFTFFRPREGMIRRTVNSDGSWSDTSSIIAPNMSAAVKAQYVSYHPQWGVITRNRGAIYGYADFPTTRHLSDGLSTFKDGRWTRRSVFHTKFDVSDNLPLMWTPRDAVVDPFSPNHIYAVSPEFGLLRQDLNDPDSNLLLGVSTVVNSNHPQFVDAFPVNIWPKIGLYIPAIDSEGRLWTVPYLHSPDGTDHEPYTSLMYWTKEDRLACSSPESYKSHPFKSITIPGFNSRYLGKIYCYDYPGYENVVIVCSRVDNSISFIYDHGGTPEDPSDDRLCSFDNLIYANGDSFPSLFIGRSAFVDPYDGKLLLSTDRGIMIMELEDLFKEKQIVDWYIPDNYPSPSNTSRSLGVGGCWGFAQDNIGRKWISTAQEGLYCISEDRKDMLAHFTKDNSPLPTNECYEIAWNPERNSLMVGTSQGLMEFIPDGTPLPESETRITTSPSVRPMAIAPDYNGHIIFSGLIDGKSYNLLSPSGEVIDIIRSSEGQADWHPASLKKPLKAGTYNLESTGCSLIVL